MVSCTCLQHCQGLHLTRVLVDTAPDRRTDFESVLEPFCRHRVCETAERAMHRVKVHDLAIGEALHVRTECFSSIRIFRCTTDVTSLEDLSSGPAGLS
jgi:hypothetical protein